MTDKAKAVLNKMKPRRLFQNPQTQGQVLGDFNRSTLDDVGPLRGDQSMAVLKEMNDFEAGHDEFVNSLAPRVDVL